MTVNQPKEEYSRQRDQKVQSPRGGNARRNRARACVVRFQGNKVGELGWSRLILGLVGYGKEFGLLTKRKGKRVKDCKKGREKLSKVSSRKKTLPQDMGKTYTQSEPTHPLNQSSCTLPGSWNMSDFHQEAWSFISAHVALQFSRGQVPPM